MTRDEITLKVAQFIAKRLKCAAASVKPDALLVDELGADSLSLIEITMDIEDFFDIDITDEEADEMRTPADLVKHVELRVGEKAGV